MALCERCPGLLFRSATERASHRRTAHQGSCKVREADGTRTTILAAAPGRWVCPSCSKVETRPDRLQMHYRNAHVVGGAEPAAPLPEETLGHQMPTPEASGGHRMPRVAPRLEEERTPEILRLANLSVSRYESMALLVCDDCNVVLDCSKADAVERHMLRRHGGARRARLYRDVANAVRALGLTPLQSALDFFAARSGLVSPVPGLLVHNGFSCSLCYYHCGCLGTMENHRRNDHAGVESCAPARCSVQCLVRGFGKRYFPVLDMLHSGTSDDGRLMTALSKSADEIDLSVRADPNPPAREVSAWLRECRWDFFASQLIPAGADFRALKATMLMPPTGEDSPYWRLPDVLTSYALLARRVGNDVEYNVLACIMGPDCTKGFTQFLVDDTLRVYRRVMLGFVLALLRSACGVPDAISVVTAPEYMREHLVALKRQLEQLGHAPIVEDRFDFHVLHRLLLGLWCPPQSGLVQARRANSCVFLQYLILNSVMQCGQSDAYSWRDVSEISQSLSILKFWCRSTFLMELAVTLWDPSARSMEIGSAVALLASYASEKPALRESPFAYVSSIQRLACTVQGDQPTKPHLVSSCPNHSWCSVHGYLITLDAYRRFLKTIIRECTRVMEVEVLLNLDTGWVLRALDGGTPIVDDLNDTRAGYSFLDDRKNPFHLHRRDLLHHLFGVVSTSSRYVHHFDETGITGFNNDRLRRLMATIKKVEERLYLILHCTSGQPPRAQEYSSLMVRNTTTNVRAFYWSEDTLVTVQVYNKTGGGSKKRAPKLICKFLAPSLRVLFLQYLCLVRPVQSFVAGVLWGPAAAALYANSWFVHDGKRATTRQFSNYLKKEYLRLCDAPLTVRTHRHVSVFFSEPIRQQCLAMRREPLDVSRGHSEETAGRHYGQNENDLRCIGRDKWRDFRLLAIRWQAHLQLAAEEGEVSHARLAATATVRPRPEVEIDITPGPKRIRVHHACVAAADRGDRLEGIAPASMRAAGAVLRELGYADWKSPHQAIATAMAVDNTRDFLAVLPTGSGKSVVFQAAALSSGKTVAIVVPLHMLLHGHIAQCRAAGITCDEFHAGNTIDSIRPPQLVFVSAEIATHDPFQRWVRLLLNDGRLHSIVIDEVHLVLSSYRARMIQLFQLSSLPCQMIGLTATLPPHKESRVRVQLGREFAVVRSGTTRPNLEYGVIDASDVDAEIVSVLSAWLALPTMATEDRALVYCMTKAEAEAMHDVLRAHDIVSTFLHSELQKPDRVDRMAAWELGTQKIMVATSIIGCGYDYPAVRLVIHRGLFRSLEDYHQQSGRCGRDGGKAVCRVVSNPQFRDRTVDRIGRSELDAKKRQEAVDDLVRSNKWIEGDGVPCRRYNLHLEMDGSGEVCALLPGCVECDICAAMRGGSQMHRPDDDGPPDQLFVPRLDSLQQEKDRLADITDLHLVREHAGNGDKCLLCWEDVHSNSVHAIQVCPRMHGLCLRCLSQSHRANACPVKKAPREPGSCFFCSFQFQMIGDHRVHDWDGSTSCQDRSGERIRTLIWWSFRDSYMLPKLRIRFRKMPLEDSMLEPWLAKIEQGRTLNNFVRVGAAIMKIVLKAD